MGSRDILRNAKRTVASARGTSPNAPFPGLPKCRGAVHQYLHSKRERTVCTSSPFAGRPVSPEGNLTATYLDKLRFTSNLSDFLVVLPKLQRLERLFIAGWKPHKFNEIASAWRTSSLNHGASSVLDFSPPDSLKTVSLTSLSYSGLVGGGSIRIWSSSNYCGCLSQATSMPTGTLLIHLRFHCASAASRALATRSRIIYPSSFHVNAGRACGTFPTSLLGKPALC